MSSLAVLTPILGAAPVRTVAEAVAVLQAIENALEPPATPPAASHAGGVACFNRVYLAVTSSVRNALDGPLFESTSFVAELDVIFANLYFAALKEYLESAREVPRAWWPVLSGNERTDVAPLQFAVAGMNAHINRDLPVALAMLWSGPLALPDLAAQKRDYERVNSLLAIVEADVKAWFLSGPWSELSRAFHGVDDVIAMFSVTEARDAAWVQGEVLSSTGKPARGRARPRLRSPASARLSRHGQEPAARGGAPALPRATRRPADRSRDWRRGTDNVTQ